MLSENSIVKNFFLEKIFNITLLSELPVSEKLLLFGLLLKSDFFYIESKEFSVNFMEYYSISNTVIIIGFDCK